MIQRTQLPNLGEFRISKVSAQIKHLLCLISTAQSPFLPLEIQSTLTETGRIIEWSWLEGTSGGHMV